MPIKPFVEHKAIISFLRKIDRLIDVSISYDIEKIKSNSLSNEVRKMFPADYEQENIDAQQYLEQEYNSDTIRIYKKLSIKLFNNNNGRVVLPESMLENYNLYTTSLDTYPIFSYYLLELSKELIDDEQRFYYIDAHLNEGYLFDSNLDKKLYCKYNEISDMHIHLGGTMDFHYRISEVIKEPYKLNKIKNHFQPNEHTFDNASNVLKNRLFILLSIYERVILSYYCNNDKESINKLIEIIEEIFELDSYDYDIDIRLYNLYKNNLNYIRNSFVTINNNQNSKFENLILQKANRYFNSENNPKSGDKALVVYILNKFLKEDRNSYIYHLIDGYFLLRNIFKSIIFQQHRRSGFGYFSSYSRNEIKKKTNLDLKYIINSVAHPELIKNIEFRVSTYSDSIAFKNWLEKFHEIVDKNNNINAKLIFHYIKQKPKLKDEISYKELREKYKHQTFILSQFLSEKAFRYNNVDLAYKYFQGIDAAANELYTPPEIFAPIYNFFKKSVISSGFAINTNGYEKPKGLDLQYTFHVGEEFKDIISGLRAIFESVVFLNLKDEDRLSHAIALGIDPEIFYRDRADIVLTYGEYMDNLVFMYYIFSTISNPPYSLEKLKNKIEEFGGLIYNKIMIDLNVHFTIEDYVAGWLLRRNCPLHINILSNKLNLDIKNYYEAAWELKQKIKEEKNSINIYYDSFNNAYLKTSLPDFVSYFDDNDELFKRYLSIRNNKNAYLIYWYYSLNHHKQDHKFNSFYKGNIKFSNDIYEYLQDYIMEKYIAKRDIVIEILPTSNLLISSIKSYDEHPFLRFHPPKEITPNKFNIRTKKIKLIIGTDNPGIQGTSLIMEYHILHNVISKKYSKRIAEKYLKEMVDFSNYLFKKIE